ncbi:MAG: bifunctional 2-methylcitrate dehydratase/aconitate hydratase [Gammaproteobacteria bacterium]
MTSNLTANIRPDYDSEIVAIADYVAHYQIDSQTAIDTARLCLVDALGCAILALNYSPCTRLLGPIVPNAGLMPGARVPGTNYELDPVQAAFNIGTMIRWLDFNDTWLAAEWGHPSDNLGCILALADYLNRADTAQKPLTMHDVLIAMIKAYEVQGIIALENSFNRVGLDHVILVKVASTAVATKLLGGDEKDITRALSQAWIDGHSLRTYRHAPNTGTRKSWAAGDATSRAVNLAFLTMRGEMGYPSALTAQNWGFQDVLFQREPLLRTQDYGSYVMENILFKISYPAEFHAQTAIECAIEHHPQVKDRLEDIDKIVIHTQEAAMRIINKTGPLYNPADRDHCIQYIIAIGLIYGGLTADHYRDEVAQDGRIDALREKMQVIEDPQYSQDYLAPEKRAIANAVQIYFQDGSCTEKIEIHYPIGHRRRRTEGEPLLMQKFSDNLNSQFSEAQSQKIIATFEDPQQLAAMPVDKFMELFVR